LGVRADGARPRIHALGASGRARDRRGGIGVLLSNTMLVLAMLLLGAGLAWQFSNQVRRSPCTFIWGAVFLVLFVAFPLVLNLCFGFGVSIRGDLLSDEAHYLVYGLVILVFSIAYAARSFLVGRGGDRPATGPTGPAVGRTGWHAASRVEKNVYLVSGLAVPAGLALFVQGTGMSLAELMIATRFEWFVRGAASGLMINLGMYAMSTVAIFTHYDIRFGMRFKWLSVLAYGSALFIVFVIGDRKWLFFIAAGGVSGLYDTWGGAFRRSGRLAAGLLTVAVLVFMLQFGRAIAWEDAAAREHAGEVVGEAIPVLFTEGDATYFYRASLDAIRVNMDEGVVFPLAIVRRILLLPLPDSWTFGLKPEGVPFLFSDLFDAGTSLRRGNMPPGLVGLFVLSFGWWLAPIMMAAILMPVLAMADRFVVRSRSPVRAALFSTFPAASVLLMRGSTGGIYFLFFNMAIVLAVMIVSPRTSESGADTRRDPRDAGSDRLRAPGLR